MKGYTYIVAFVWFLYRHASHSYDLGWVEKEYNLFMQSIENGFVCENGSFRPVNKEDMKSGFAYSIRCRYEGLMQMHRVYSYIYMVLSAFCLMYFIWN